MWENMMSGPYWGGMGVGMIGMIGMAIFWVVVIALLVRVFRSGGKRRSRTDATPLEVLQKRYASGAIQREEYEQKKRDLDI
jgi:putative membrane protein